MNAVTTSLSGRDYAVYGGLFWGHNTPIGPDIGLRKQ